MKITWDKCFCSIFCFLNCFWMSFSISDEEYAQMPEVFVTENYDNCMLLKEKAFYCAIHYELTPINPENPPEVWKTIKEYNTSDLHYRHDILRRFVCVPKTCPNVKTFNTTHPSLRKELKQCFDDQYRNQGFEGSVEIINCKKAGPIYKIDKVDIIVALIFFSYIGLILIFTALDFFKSYDEEKHSIFKNSKGGKIVVAFSIMNNWNKLKSIPSGPEFERLKPVQGLRVYMSITIVIIHTLLSNVAVPVSNTKFVEDINDSPDLITDIPKRAVFMLSFHFMMSSWILITSILNMYDRNEVIDFKFIIKSILKRYIRFFLTIAVVIGFYATWFRHIPYGPFFDGVCDESERCRNNWWTNFLFIQNHYNRYYMCHIISWYLAVEMQYYIVGLFLIMVIMKFKINIPLITTLLLVVNFFFAFWDHKRHGYPSRLNGQPEELYRLLFNRKSQWHDHFASYHGNAAGYITGIGFGYIFHKYKNQKIFTSLWRKIAWLILSSFIVGTTFVVPQIIDVDATTTHSALWVALTRPLFSIGMGLFILGLSEGLGGWSKDVLNWSPLYVLGKLSFCVYICHTIFQNLRVGFLRYPVYVSYYTMVEAIASDVLLSFLAALFLSLVFEMPSNELANQMFGSRKKTGKIKTK